MSNKRRRLTGVVTKAKVPKTVTVEVGRDYRHALYEKVLHRTERYLAHDEFGCQPGDEVIIVESRPISKRKHWVVQEIVHKLTEAEVAAEQQEIVDETEPVLGLGSEEDESEAAGEIEAEPEAEAEVEAEE